MDGGQSKAGVVALAAGAEGTVAEPAAGMGAGSKAVPGSGAMGEGRSAATLVTGGMAAGATAEAAASAARAPAASVVLTAAGSGARASVGDAAEAAKAGAMAPWGADAAGDDAGPTMALEVTVGARTGATGGGSAWARSLTKATSMRTGDVSAAPVPRRARSSNRVTSHRWTAETSTKRPTAHQRRRLMRAAQAGRCSTACSWQVPSRAPSWA